MKSCRKIAGTGLAVLFTLFSLGATAQEGLPPAEGARDNSFSVRPGEVLSTLSDALKQVSALNPLSGAKNPGRGRGADVESFDIAGVRPGMSMDEAFAAITRHYGIKKSAIRPEGLPGYNQVTGVKEPAVFYVEHGGATIAMSFVPRLPVDAARPHVLWNISYKLPLSTNNSLSLRQAAIEKYGQPTADTVWCRNPTSSAIGGCPVTEPSLQLLGRELQLSNPGYRDAVLQYVMRKGDVKPAF